MKWLKNLLGGGGGEQKAEPASVANVQKEAGGLYVIRLAGTLTKEALDRIQDIAKHDIARGATDMKILIVLANFQGWKKGDDWGDMDFFSRHEANIARMAVVGDEKWKSETLMFLGAGQRTGEARYFLSGQDAQARAWLLG